MISFFFCLFEPQPAHTLQPTSSLFVQVSVIPQSQQLAAPPGRAAQPLPPQVPQLAAQHVRQPSHSDVAKVPYPKMPLVHQAWASATSGTSRRRAHLRQPILRQSQQRETWRCAGVAREVAYWTRRARDFTAPGAARKLIFRTYEADGGQM